MTATPARDIRPTSQAFYNRSFEMLQRVAKASTVEELKDWIMGHVPYSPLTRRNYLSVLVRKMQEGQLPYTPEMWKEISRLRDELNAAQRARYALGEMSAKQKEALSGLTIDGIHAAFERLKAERGRSKGAFTDCLLLGILLEYRLRNDAHELKVITTREGNDEEGNFILREPGEQAIIILNHYKTSDKYGPKEYLLSPELTTLIVEYLTKYPGTEYLFEKIRTHIPLDAALIGHKLNALIERTMGTKHVGTNILRRLYAQKHADAMRDMMKEARDQGHDVAVHLGVYSGLPNGGRGRR